MNKDLLLIFVVTFVFIGGFFSVGKAIYHMWFVVTGIRPSMQNRASLLGPFALFFPSLFEEKAQVHLRRLGLWMPLGMAFVIGGLVLQLIMEAA